MTQKLLDSLVGVKYQHRGVPVFIPVAHAESMIPRGPYCYTPLGIERNEWGFPVFKTKPCPFHRLLVDQPAQMNGYCNYLRMGDMTDGGTMLLFDAVKECGIRNEDDLDAPEWEVK